MLQYHFNWKTLSVIAGITLWNFYFRLYPGAIRAPQVVAFLKHLLRHIPGKLLLVWDRLPAHRSRAGAGVRGRAEGPHPHRVPARLRSGIESHRIHLGPRQTPQTSQRLPQGLRRTQTRRPPRPPQHAPPPHPHYRLLETGFLVARMTLYYAGLSRPSWPRTCPERSGHRHVSEIFTLLIPSCANCNISSPRKDRSTSGFLLPDLGLLSEVSGFFGKLQIPLNYHFMINIVVWNRSFLEICLDFILDFT